MEPGRYSPPWGGREGMNQHGELTEDAGTEGPSGTGVERLLAADRDRFSFQVRGQSESASAVSLRGGHVCEGATASLCQACPGTVSPRRVAMKVAFPGGSSVPEGQVPLSLLTLASVPPVEQGTIGPDPGSIGTKYCSERPQILHFPRFPHSRRLMVRRENVCSVPQG